MKFRHNSDVHVFAADSQPAMRRVLRHALRELGFGEVSEFSDVRDIKYKLDHAQPDLLILDLELEGGDVCEMVREIRHNNLGRNPFVPIVITTWENNEKVIKQVVDCGVDGLLVKPLSTTAISKHIDAITVKRQPFVLTTSYIGPDRRAKVRPDDTSKRIEVPNVLQAKRSGKAIDYAVINELISSEIRSVNQGRLRKNAAKVSDLAERVLSTYESQNLTEGLERQLRMMEQVSKDTSRRVLKTEFAHLSELCESLVNVVGSILSEIESPSDKDLKLLKPLCDSIATGINPTENVSDLAGAISSSISNFKSGS